MTAFRAARRAIIQDQPAKSDDRSNVWPVLSLIRFVLSLVIAIGHTRPFIPTSDKPEAIVHTFLWLSMESAVFCFLLISGYSIAASYKKEPNGFYFRRWLRIFPLYIPLVTLSALLPEFFGGKISYISGDYVTPGYYQVVLNLCMLQGIVVDALPNLGVVWTLSIEWTLYLLTPLLAKLSNRTILLIATISAVFHLGLIHYETLPPGKFGKPILSLSWIWFSGFWLYRMQGSAISALLVLAGGSAVFALLQSFWRGPFYELLWIVTILGIVFGSRFRLGQNLITIMVELGEISYPLYLVHIIVYAILTGLHIPAGTWFIVPAIGIAALLNYFYDKPLKRWLAVRFI